MKNHTTLRAPRFDRQWTELINMLPDENERKLLTDAIVKYQLDATEPDLPTHLAVAFGFIRPTIDRRARARMRRRERTEKQHQAETAPQAKVEAPTSAIATKPAQTATKATKKAAKMKKHDSFNKIILMAKRHRDNPRSHITRH